jgi:hypothetical protein
MGSSVNARNASIVASSASPRGSREQRGIVGLAETDPHARVGRRLRQPCERALERGRSDLRRAAAALHLARVRHRRKLSGGRALRVEHAEARDEAAVDPVLEAMGAASAQREPHLTASASRPPQFIRTRKSRCG